MKKLLVATAVAMALSATAQADSTAVLKLKGVLTNDACTPDLNGGAVVDFGTKYVSSLSATSENQLGYKDITLTINCTAPTKVAWTIIDNHADSVSRVTIENATRGGYEVWSSNALYGVGKTAGNVNIGAYSVTFDRNVTINGGETYRIGHAAAGVDGDSTWIHVTSDADSTTNSAGAYEYTVIDLIDDIAHPFTTAVFPLRVALAIQDTTTLAITDDTPIDGQATISLNYL